MRKTLALAVLLATSLLPSAVRADGGPVLGVDLQAALPVGDFGDGAGIGFGGLLRYEFTIVNAANVTARAGMM